MSLSYDWSRFTKRININATTKQLYNACATRAGIESWFLRKGEFRNGTSILPNEQQVEAGNKYTWNWHGYGDEVVERGEITMANGKDQLEFSFAANMKVRIQLKTENGENIVELQQYDIPTDDQSKINFHMSCAEGWVFYLANLKSVLEGGIDLRNKNENIKKVVNA